MQNVVSTDDFKPSEQVGNYIEDWKKTYGYSRYHSRYTKLFNTNDAEAITVGGQEALAQLIEQARDEMPDVLVTLDSYAPELVPGK